jgi:HEAT repeat protein
MGKANCIHWIALSLIAWSLTTSLAAAQGTKRLNTLEVRALQNLKSSDSDVRGDAIGYLFQRGAALPHLVEVIRNPRNSDFHRAAAIIAASWDTENSRSDGIVAEAIVFALQRGQPRRVRRAAVDALGNRLPFGKLREIEIDSLREIVLRPDEEPRLRQAAAISMAGQGQTLSSSVVGTFLEIANGTTPLELRIAILRPLKAESSSQVVANALGSIASSAKEPELREAAIETLSEAGAKIVLVQLISLLGDSISEIRLAAANAIATTGTAGRAAMEDLRVMAADQQALPEVRLSAVSALRGMGAAEQRACSTVLSIASLDGDLRLRQESVEAAPVLCPDKTTAVGPLANIVLKADAPALLRGSAAESLGSMGHEAASAVTTLQNVVENSGLQGLTLVATKALGLIGPASTSATDDLRHIMDNAAANPELRLESAAALLLINPGDARVADEVATFAIAFPRDDFFIDPDSGDVAIRAARRVIEIARKEAVTQSPATFGRNVADYQRRLATIADFLKSSDRSDEAEVRAYQNELTNLRPSLQQQLRASVVDHPLRSLFIGYVLITALVTFILLALRPIWILQINEALRPLGEFTLPNWLGGLTVKPSYLLVCGFFHYHPRTLDAWTMARIDTVRVRFRQRPTVAQRVVHVTLPILKDGILVPELTPADLRPIFGRRPSCLLITGEGGTGKTSLACRIGQWAMMSDASQRIAPHPMIPLLLDDELPQSFISALRRQLQDLTGDERPIPNDLLETLLRRQRLVVIVDHLSEMSLATQAKIAPGEVEFPANALIVTSRFDEKLGGVGKTTILPRRIAGNYVSEFLGAYLAQANARDLFSDSEFFKACGRLSEIVGPRNITVLLAKLYAEQLIQSKQPGAESQAPEHIPDLMLRYVNRLNGSVADSERRQDRLVHADAKALAHACVFQTLRPGWTRLQRALEVLGEPQPQERLNYLETRLRLVEIAEPDQDRVRFLLDPLAEYLAALHEVEVNGTDPALWKAFLLRADSMPGAPDTIQGFLLALKDCCAVPEVRAVLPPFIELELSERTNQRRAA